MSAWLMVVLLICAVSVGAIAGIGFTFYFLRFLLRKIIDTLNG